MKFSTSQIIFLLMLTLSAIIALCMVGFVGYQIFFEPVELKEVALPQLPLGWEAISAVIGLFGIIFTAFIEWPKIRTRFGSAAKRKNQKQPSLVFQETVETINLVTPLTNKVSINSTPFKYILVGLVGAVSGVAAVYLISLSLASSDQESFLIMMMLPSVIGSAFASLSSDIKFQMEISPLWSRLLLSSFFGILGGLLSPIAVCLLAIVIVVLILFLIGYLGSVFGGGQNK